MFRIFLKNPDYRISLIMVMIFVLVGFESLHKINYQLELFAHVKPHSLFLCIFTFLYSIWKRFNLSIISSIATASLLAFQISPLYTSPKNQAELKDPQSVRFFMSNVQKKYGNPNKLNDSILSSDADVVFLMEISKDWVNDLEPIRKLYPHSKFQPKSSNFGIGVFSRIPLHDSSVVFFVGEEIPSVFASFQLPNGQLLSGLFTHPMPPTNLSDYNLRNEHLDKATAFIQNMPSPKVFLGDLNMTAWTPRFKQLMQRTGLSDCRKGFGIIPTWPSMTFPFQIALDHCFYSEKINIKDIRALDSIESDHLPMLIDIEVGI